MPIPLFILAIVEMATLRTLVMAVVSGAAWEIGSNAIEKLFDTIVSKMRSYTGESEDSVWINIGEYILGILGGSLALFMVLRGRLPVRIADKLGLVLRKKPQAVIKPTVEDVAKVAVGSVGRSSSVVMTGLKLVGAFVGTSSIALLAVAQWIDFGNWNSGAYQGTFNKLFATFGLVPDATFAKSTQVSSDMWKKIFQFYQQRGAIGIIDPTGNSDLPFTAENLAIIVDRVAIAMTAEGEKVTYKNVLGLTQAMIIYKTGNPVEPITPTSSSTTGTSTPSATKPPVEIKIFTGVVANGALGAPNTFTERQDDMIVNATELLDAAKNNLTAYVVALPGKFYYEIAIVNSVKTKSGFTQKGAAQRVVSGYNKDNTPRYKTIYNKFAVMRIGVLDANGRTVKLQEIILGPVDASVFQPTTAQLADVAKTITPELFTTDVGEVKSIVTTSPVTVTPPAVPSPQPVTYVPTQPAPATGGATVSTPSAPSPAPVVSTPPPATPAPSPPPPPALTAQQLAVKNATNLSEAYASIGGLPSISQRANLYQAWGLGQASMYVGSVEQNTKYLAELKRQFGVG